MCSSYEEKLDLILTRIEGLEKRLDRIEQSCAGMDDHISFIDSVYLTLRAPLDWVARKFSGSNARRSLPLPPAQPPICDRSSPPPANPRKGETEAREREL